MAPPARSTYVALLRGINVGGKNKLPMAELARIFAAAGCEDVRTYIQSGNVVFSAGPKLGPLQLATRLRLEVPVVIRSSAELARVVARNPFLKRRIDHDWLHVAFLADAPDRSRAASLDPDRSPGDEFVLRGREIYLHLPNGAGKSKLTNAWFDSKLATTSTIRNWRTVLTLLEMARAPGPSAR